MSEAPVISLAEFLIDLFEVGRVRVPSPAHQPLCDDAANDVLRRFDATARRAAPGEPPAFDLAAAQWGAQVLFRACQFLVDRAAPMEYVQADFQTRLRPVPTVPPLTKSVVWSVDLTLQKLPDLHVLARGLPVDDPLVVGVSRLAADWPLSSVGVKFPSHEPPPIAIESLAVVLANTSLRTMYVDRILAKRDRQRIAEPLTLQAVQGAVGLFPELAPDWAALWESSANERESGNLD